VSQLAVLVFLGAIAACGAGNVDGADYVGSYEVTSHRESHQQGDPVSCSDPGPEIEVGSALYAPYFAIVVDEFFADPDFLEFQPCAGPGTGCEDTFIGLSTEADGLGESSANTQVGGGTDCTLYAGRTTFVLDGEVGTLEVRAWSDFDADPSDCTVEAAEALVGTALCQDVEIWVGTRVPA